MVKEYKKVCPPCGNPFVASHRNRIYCSIRCCNKARKLDIGITEKEWGFLREFILERDDYHCQECGKFMMDIGLEVHHIKTVRHGGDNGEKNLITLCHRCHKHSHHLK